MEYPLNLDSVSITTYCSLNLTDRNISSSSNDMMTSMEDVVSVVIPIIFALIIVCGLAGNLVIVFIICCNKHMQNPTNLLILNLSAADMSFLLVCIPFTAFKYSSPVWIFGDIWCKIYQYATHVCAYASVYTLVLLCVDRLAAVVFPTKLGKIRSKASVRMKICSLWIVIVLINIPVFLYHGKYVYEIDGVERSTCMFLPDVDSSTRKTFQLCFFIFGFMLPVTLIIVMYAILVTYFLKQRIPKGFQDRNLSKAKKMVTVTVIVVVSVFIVCWLPIQIILLLHNFDMYPQNQWSFIIQWTANCMAYINSCINPVLYTMTSSVFRKAIADLLHRKACMGADQPPVPSNTKAGKAMRGDSTNGVKGCAKATGEHGEGKPFITCHLNAEKIT